MYDTDLAHIHHQGFSEFATSAAAAIVPLLQAQGIASGVVIDAGCGSGVLSAVLARHGYTVLGFDPSPAMIAIARETVPGVAFEVAAVDEVVLPRCRAVLAVGEVLSYAGFDAARAFLEEAAAAIEPGGLLLFDVAERGGFPPHDELRAGGDDWSVIVLRDSDGRRVVRKVLTFRQLDGEVRRGDERHELELYDRAELTAAVREAGFRVRVRRSYGARRLPPGNSVYIAQRRGA